MIDAANEKREALLEEVEQTAGEVPLREVGRRAALQALADRWPDDAEVRVLAWLGRAEVALAAGDREEAVRLARRALEATSDPVYRERAEAALAEP